MADYVHLLIVKFWSTMTEMSPYLLFGFLVAGILSVLLSPKLVERHLGSGGFSSTVKGALFGIPMPLCSCGVIPVSMSLYKQGASKAATISFLLSTPQTGVDNIFIVYSLLGPVFAVFSPIVAMITGLFGGTMVWLCDRSEAQTMPPAKQDCCSSSKKENRLLKALRYSLLVLPSDIARPMFAGLLIAALISATVPDDFFSNYLSAGGGFVAMIVMMAVGIPMYVCSAASVPIAAAMIAKGLNPGAAMVFLMTGPATNAAALTTLWSTLGGRTTILYLASIVICAFAAGFAMDYLFRGTAQEGICAHGWMLPAWFGNGCAVFLLAVLFWAMTHNPHQNTTKN